MKRKSKDFKSLEALWYKKLEESGFQDIETSEQHLEYWHSRLFQDQNTPDTFKAKEAYYQLAGQFLHDHTFDSPFEQTIWALHCEGLSNRKIYQKLQGQYEVGRIQINNLINRLSKIMLARLK